MSTAKESKENQVDQHLDTEHLRQNLSQRALSGGAITGIAQGFKFLLNLASAVILARLLSPPEFGLVAIVGALMSILRVFREGGLSTATIQRENITQVQVSNLFWINLSLGGLLTLICAACAPLIGWFYRDDRLIGITLFLALTFAINGLAVQHLALLNRQMRFIAIAVIDIGSIAGGLIVGVVMALSGYGYWSLVGMQVATAVIETSLTWIASSWRPSWFRRGQEMGSLLKFGAALTVAILLRRIAQGIDVLLLGRFAGAVSTGLYSRAQVLLQRPLDQLVGPFDAVFVPLMSRLQSDAARYRSVFITGSRIIALASFPFAGLALGTSKPLVLTLLGEKWAEVVPIYACFAISALHLPISSTVQWLLTTQGRTKDLMYIGVLQPVFAVISVLAGLPFGAVGVALSFSLVSQFIRVPVIYYIAGKSGPIRTGDLWGVFARYLPLWLTAAVASWVGVQLASAHSPAVQLFSGCLISGTLVLLLVFAIPSLRADFLDIWKRVPQVLGRRIAKT